MPRPRSRRSRSDSRPPAEQTFACRHFGICGGCSLLDQPIAWQLHDKLERCRELLAPFLNGCEIEHGLPRRPQQHFRTRLLYPVRQDKDRQPVLGIYEYQSHHVVRIDECRTQDRWLTELGRRIEPILKELRIEGFHAGRRRGIAKAFWARLMSGTGEVLAGLVTRPGAFDQGSAFADALMAATTDMPRTARGRRLVGVMHSISDRTDGFLLGDRHVPLRGRDYVTDERDGLTFRVSAGSFYQIHAGAHALLYRPAMAMCGDLRDRRVVDGYGGVGAFGLRAAKAGAKDVLVVEDNASSCRDAEHNKRLNELPQVAVQRAPFADADLPDDIDLLIVDPPRAGLQRRGVERALAARPERILHVACNAESLRADLSGLSAGGYRLAAIRLCDLFPHTEHVELVALLERA